MAAADDQHPPAEPTTTSEPVPAVPDYLASPNAVFTDPGVEWRYGRAPDYSKTRKVWEEGKRMNHAAGSLPQLVENLVKNWEVEASFKSRLQDWRTIDHANYTFAINGGPSQSAEHMLKVGTYNAIIAPNEYYSPANSDFASSHKTFKRMMPTFAWEVLEVYSGPPKVAFKWRHWGVMKEDYVGFNDKGERITAKAHGGPIDIEGVTVAQVDDQVRLQAVETWFDPLEMFRQIAPHGVVNKVVMDKRVEKVDALDPVPNNDGVNVAQNNQPGVDRIAPEDTIPKYVANSTGQPANAFVPHQGANLEKPANTCAVTATTEPIIKGVRQLAGYSDRDTPALADNFQRPQQPVQDSDVTSTTIEPTQPAKVDAEHTTVGAQAVVDTAAAHGAEMPTNKPESNIEYAFEQQEDKEPSEGGSSDRTWEKVDKPESSPTEESSSDMERSIYSLAATGNKEKVLEVAKAPDFVDESVAAGVCDAADEHLESTCGEVHPRPKDVEDTVQPKAGEAVAASRQSEETRMTHEEMSRITVSECPFLMNRE